MDTDAATNCAEPGLPSASAGGFAVLQMLTMPLVPGVDLAVLGCGG